MPEYDPQDEQQANQDLLERFNEQIQPDESEPQAPPPSQDDDEPELSVDESPEEDDDESGKKTRQEKKRDRFKQLKEERDEERKRAQELEKRLASIEQRAAAYPDPNTLQQHLLQRGQPQQAQEDPTDSELQDVYSQQEQLFQYANAQWNNLDRTEREKIQKRARDLDEKKAELLYQKAAKKHQPQQPDQRQLVRQTLQAQIQHEHSDVYQNPAAVQYANGEYARLRHQGYPDSMETLKQAMDSARGAFGMKRRASEAVKPTEAQRRRLAGMPKGGGEGGAKRRTIKMTQDYKDMADAAFPNIEDDAKRYQHWANTVGKKLVGGE